MKDAPVAWRINFSKPTEVANTKWWEQFGDPVINGLIEAALRDNYDVRTASGCSRHEIARQPAEGRELDDREKSAEDGNVPVTADTHYIWRGERAVREPDGIREPMTQGSDYRLEVANAELHQWPVASIALLMRAIAFAALIATWTCGDLQSLRHAFTAGPIRDKIMNKWIQGIAGGLIPALVLLSSACTVSGGQQGDSAARVVSMDADIDRALSQLAQQASGSDQLVASAKGVLVFPTVLSAGLGIGGSHGLGGLRREGKTIRHYRMTAASVGLLAGARSKTVVYLFMTDEALKSFEASSGWTVGADASVTLLTVGANAQIDTQSARQPVVGFVLTNAGLMGNLSMDGTRIAPTTL